MFIFLNSVFPFRCFLSFINRIELRLYKLHDYCFLFGFFPSVIYNTLFYLFQFKLQLSITIIYIHVILRPQPCLYNAYVCVSVNIESKTFVHFVVLHPTFPNGVVNEVPKPPYMLALIQMNAVVMYFH